MDRYNVIKNKNVREIVLLKSQPCIWGKCRFCDYIADNATDFDEIETVNESVLKMVTGKYKQLEIINSGSVFEIPESTMIRVREVVNDLGIEKLYFESHYIYRKRLKEVEDYFNIPIIFKCGIETFDHDFRLEVLNKGIGAAKPEEIARYFKSVCLLVGIKGQTKEMIRRDIDLLLQYFHFGCINIFNENTTPIKKDEELIQWFINEYSYLEDMPNIEILRNNTDFGVGE